MYYFELFEIPVSLKINKAILLKKYYELSKKFHPDNFSLSNKSEQENSLLISSKINEAKLILDDKYKRLEYILKEKGIIQEDEKYTLPPAFLGEMMDYNEQAEEIDKNNEQQIQNFKIAIKNIEDELFDEVHSFFEMDELILNEKENKHLKEYYYKHKYLKRLVENL